MLLAKFARVQPGTTGLQEDPLPEPAVRAIIAAQFVLFACVAVMHLTTLGYLPIVKAYDSGNDYEIARIRQDGYYTLAVWQRYASDYAIKAIGPIVLVLAARYKSPFLYPTLVVGIIYTSALFVKVNPVYLLLPLVVFYALTLQLMRSVFIAGIMVVTVGLCWTSSSPAVREDAGYLLRVPMASVAPAPTVPAAKSSGHESVAPAPTVSAATSSGQESVAPARTVPAAKSLGHELPGAALYASVRERFVIVPAQVTWQWFFHYTESEQRERGCGYRLVAKLLGCEYQHIPTKLYAVYYSDLVKSRGLSGSLNSGSYLHDFANFGYPGVIASAVVFTLIFTALRMFCGASPVLLSLSLMPVLSLMEMPISTVLNSGGWLLIIFVSILLQYGGRLVPERGPPGT